MQNSYNLSMLQLSNKNTNTKQLHGSPKKTGKVYICCIGTYSSVYNRYSCIALRVVYPSELANGCIYHVSHYQGYHWL